MSYQDPAGSAVVDTTHKHATNKKNCDKTVIEKLCKTKLSKKFCDAMINSCPNNNNSDLMCKLNDPKDNHKCLTCNEVLNTVCGRSSKFNECKKKAETLSIICPETFINIDNINHSDNMLLYIIMFFIIYKIIYKK